MNGKQVCKNLKKIRRQIAEANHIPLEIPECSYAGDCAGTCPRCEEEMRILREGLEARKEAGLPVVVPRVETPRAVSGPAFRPPEPPPLQGQVITPPPPLAGVPSPRDWEPEPTKKKRGLFRRERKE